MAVALVTLTVNARLSADSAAFRPWFSQGNPVLAYGSLLTLTDSNYISGQRYYHDGAAISVSFSGRPALWVSGSPRQYGLSRRQLIQNPRAFGIDLVMPIFFSPWLRASGKAAMTAWAGWCGSCGIHRAALAGRAIHVVIGSLAGMAVVGLADQAGCAGGVAMTQDSVSGPWPPFWP